MPHNFRHAGFRGRDEERGGRMRARSDRNQSGNEERYLPDWDDPNAARGFEGDRSYRTEGYAENLRRGQGGGSSDFGRGQGHPGADYGSEGRWGRERWENRDNDEDGQSRGEGNMFDSERGYRTSRYENRGERLGDRGRRTGLLRWDSAADDGGDYFGTGSYYGAYGSQPGASASGRTYGDRGYLGADENRWNDEREDMNEARGWYGGSSGSEETYGRSDYGAQSGYGREYGPRFGSQSGYVQDYRERFGEQRYGRDPEFGYGYAQEGTQGTFRGRGPKGYERSDERLREMICERLTDDPRIDASEVHVEVKDKIVKLSGVVSDRRTKYEIEDLVERCGGVKDIDNQVRVQSGYGMTQASGGRISTNDTSASGAEAESQNRGGMRSGSAKRSS